MAARQRVVGRLLPLFALVLIGSCSVDTTPPDEWAGQVCAALVPWRGQITELNAAATQELASAGTPVETRTSLLTLVVGAELASEAARAAVAAAGVPDVEGGEEIARRFTASLAGTRDSYARARERIEGLPVTDEKQFYDGVVSVLARLNSEYASSGIDTTSLESVDLRAAFDHMEQCR